jgi:hypothetical protein
MRRLLTSWIVVTTASLILSRELATAHPTSRSEAHNGQRAGSSSTSAEMGSMFAQERVDVQQCRGLTCATSQAGHGLLHQLLLLSLFIPYAEATRFGRVEATHFVQQISSHPPLVKSADTLAERITRNKHIRRWNTLHTAGRAVRQNVPGCAIRAPMRLVNTERPHVPSGKQHLQDLSSSRRAVEERHHGALLVEVALAASGILHRADEDSE